MAGMSLKSYLPILLLTFVNVVGFAILIPVLPEIVTTYLEPPYVGLTYGLLISSYSFFQFLAAPIMGALSDRYGRRPLLFFSQLGTLISWCIFAAAYFVPAEATVAGLSLPIVIIALSRVIDGITGGNASVAMAWVSDRATPEQKTSIFGIQGAVFGLGFIIGPLIGGITGSTEIGYLGTAIASILLSLVTLIFIALMLPESLAPEHREDHVDLHLPTELNVISRFWQFRSNRFVMQVLLMRLFFALVFASYTTLLVLKLELEYSLSTTELGLAFAVVGIYAIVNQLFLVGRISRLIGDLNVVYLSYAATFLGLILFALVPSRVELGGFNISLGILAIVSYILVVGVSFGMPAFKSVLSNAVSERKQGVITGLDEALISLGQAITPAIAGLIYTIIGAGTFVWFALLLLVPFLIIWLRHGSPLVRQQYRAK